MTLELIVCKTPSGVIGANGGLPWEGIIDGKVFRKFTLGKVCVMGRRTWQSLPGPLPGRTNVVVSSTRPDHKDGASLGVIWSRSIDEVLDLFEGDQIIFLGGAQIYEEVMDLVDTMYITTTNREYEGDTYFPEIKRYEWMVHRDYYRTPDFSCSIWNRHPFPELCSPRLYYS